MAAASIRYPLAVLVCLLALGATAAVGAETTQTLKERLSDKASDEQRLNNCGVPVERRGLIPRPGCPGEDASNAAARPSTGGQGPDTSGQPDAGEDWP